MKKLFLFFIAKKVLFFAFLFMPIFASAAAYAPVKVSNAVSGAIQQKLVNRGFAANDPRIAQTIQTSGNVIVAAAATGAAAVVVGAITAPAWVTAAIAAGVGAVVAYAVSLAIDGITEWLFGSDSSQVDVVVADSSVPPQSGLYKGGPFWQTNYGYGATAELAVLADWVTSISVYDIKCKIPDPVITSSVALCSSKGKSPGDPYPLIIDDTKAYFQATGSPVASSTGSYQRGFGEVKVPDTGTTPGFGKTGILGIQTAVDQISDTEKSKLLNPQIVAALANQAWQKAAQAPDYQGLPYQNSDPITAADADAWRNSNASSWPSVGDFVSPFPNGSPGTGTSKPPFSLPTPDNGSNPDIPVNPENPGSKPDIDLGKDPGIGSPTLEPTPTGAQILAPITGLMPDLRNFQVPSHQGECPKPEFDIAVLHTRVRMDAQCTLFEEVRGPLYNGSLVAWIIAALFIVLSA